MSAVALAFPATPPMPAVARILARFEREQLAGFIAVALDLIDTLDGDPDLENATDLEDDFALSRQALSYDTGPGCATTDTGEEDDNDSGVEDDPKGIDPEEDLGAEERGEPEDWQEPPVADPDAHREQMLRIQQTRCFPLLDRSTRRINGHMLLVEPTVPTKGQLLRRKRGVPKRPRG